MSLMRPLRRISTPAIWLSLAVVCSSTPAWAQPQETIPPQAASTRESASHPLPGTICGSVVDRSGALAVGAKIKLTRENASAGSETVSADDGRFCLTNLAGGAFQLTATLEGFKPQTLSGTLRDGEDYSAPPIVMEIASASAEVRVTPSTVEIAQEEIKAEEKQRALGIVPNFYVTYVHDAMPLTPKQKFELAWKTTSDPVSFGLNSVVAGAEQASNTLSGYG